MTGDQALLLLIGAAFIIFIAINLTRR